MSRGIKGSLRLAYKNVSAEISVAGKGGFYAAGLASGGYAGGYRQAISDVRAALDGVPPSNSRYWPKASKEAP